MGKAGGSVKGKTKRDTYSAFVRIRKSATSGLVLDYPKTREDAYRQMEKDPETGEWVLHYHFSA